MYLRAMRSMTTVRVAATMVAAIGMGLTVAAQTPADVAGDWALSVDTEQGTTTPSVMLEQNGTELTGHYSGSEGHRQWERRHVFVDRRPGRPIRVSQRYFGAFRCFSWVI